MKKDKKPLEGILITEELTFSPSDIEFLEVDEADKAKGTRRVKLTVIKAGISSNLNYYSTEVLQKLPPFIEAHPKMYLDHDMWGGIMGRSMKEWAATITKVWYDDKESAVKAEARMTSNPNTVWLYEEMRSDPKDVGCSIDARVMAHEEEIDLGSGNKIQAKVVDSWVVLNSVDFVTYAAAGGGIERIAASENPVDFLKMLFKAAIESQSTDNPNKPTKEEASMTLDELKKAHPELLQSFLQEAEIASLKELKDVKVAHEAEKTTLAEANVSLKKQAEDAATKVTALETEKKDLQAKLDVYLTKEAQEAHKAAIDKKLDECVTKGTLKKEQISDKFRELLYGIQDDSKVDILITEREDAFSTAGVKDNGQRAQASTETGKPKMTAEQLAAGIKARN